MKTKKLMSALLSMAMAASCASVLNVSAVEPSSTIDEWINSGKGSNWYNGGSVYSGEDANGILSTGNTWAYSNDVLYIHGSEEADMDKVFALRNSLHAHAILFGEEVNILNKVEGNNLTFLAGFANGFDQFETNIYIIKGSPAEKAYEEEIAIRVKRQQKSTSPLSEEKIRSGCPVTFIDSEENFVPEIVPDNPYFFLEDSEYEYYPEDDMLVFRGGKLEKQVVREAYYKYNPSIIYVASDVNIGDKLIYTNLLATKHKNPVMYELTYKGSYINTVDIVDGQRVYRYTTDKDYGFIIINYDDVKNIRVIAEYGSDAHKVFEEDVIGYALSCEPNKSEEEIRSRYNFEVADDSEAYAFLDKVRVKDSANSDSISILENESVSLGDTTSDGTVYGDVSGNGKIDIIDAVQIMSYDTNSTVYPLDDAALSVADVYNIGDGVNNMDALAIQNYLTNNIG